MKRSTSTRRTPRAVTFWFTQTFLINSSHVTVLGAASIRAFMTPNRNGALQAGRSLQRITRFSRSRRNGPKTYILVFNAIRETFCSGCAFVVPALKQR